MVLAVLALDIKRICAGGADGGSAVPVDLSHHEVGQELDVSLVLQTLLGIQHQDAFPSLLDRHNLNPGVVFRLHLAVDRGINDPLDGRVKTGAVAAAGQYSNAHSLHASLR